MAEEEQLPVRLQLPAGNEDTTDVTGLDTDENGPNTVTNVTVGTFSSSLSFTGNDGPVAYSFLPVLDGTPAGCDTSGPNSHGITNMADNKVRLDHVESCNSNFLASNRTGWL